MFLFLSFLKRDDICNNKKTALVATFLMHQGSDVSSNRATRAQCSISIERGVKKSDTLHDNFTILINALRFHSDDIFPFDFIKE